MRTATIVFLLALTAPAFAQTADTTSAWRYFPLHIGDVWEYELSEELCDFEGGCGNPMPRGYTRRAVTSEELVDGTRYMEIRQEHFSSSEVPEPDNVYLRLVRFDTLDAHPKELVDGEEIGWPWFFHCRLDGPFPDSPLSDKVGCEATAGGYETDIVIGEDTLTTASKRFRRPDFTHEFAADVGMASLITVFYLPDPTYINTSILTYARVGRLEYGTERFPVAAEDGAPGERALALAVYPNPSRGDATVRFVLDRPQRVTLAVFDVLGRRVLAADLGPQPTGEATHRLDAAGLPAGLYVVCLTGDAGAAATARIVRH